MQDIFNKSRLPGKSPVVTMINTGDFAMFSNREHQTPTKKDPSVFIGSHIHNEHWKQTKSTRHDPNSNRVFLNDYIYPDHHGKHKKKPRPNFFIGKTKDMLKGFATENTFRNDTNSTNNVASDS